MTYNQWLAIGLYCLGPVMFIVVHSYYEIIYRLSVRSRRIKTVKGLPRAKVIQ
jgi:uncharacterized membrane protein